MPDPGTLGELLKMTRSLRGLTLKGVAEPAGISATYLQNLERGAVAEPSLHHLRSLSKVLDLPYATLIELAGYELPELDDSDPNPVAASRSNPLLNALAAQEVTVEETQELLDYLQFIRRRQSRLLPPS